MINFIFVVLGMEPRALCMIGKYSTIKLELQPFLQLYFEEESQ